MSDIDLTPPRKDEHFLEYWEVLIEDVRHRENLKPSHLLQLRVLCELYTQYDRIQTVLDENGYTYEVDSPKHGWQIKPRPEVVMVKSVLAEIRAYSGMLGLRLVKDTHNTKEQEKDEWD